MSNLITWMSDARRPVAEYAAALGFDGSRRLGFACPSCKADRRGRSDRRGAVGVGRDEMSWRCFLCSAGGTGLDFASYHLHGHNPRDCTSDERRALRGWIADRGWCSPPGTRNDASVVAPPPPAPRPPPPLVRAPLAEVEAYWRASWALDAPPRDEWGLPAYTFLHQRALHPLIQTIVRSDLARWAPPAAEYAPPASWWSSRWPPAYRLMVRAWEANGTLGGLHARAILPIPEGAPKTRWPRGVDAAGLLFACPFGLALLRGEPIPYLGAVMICEGLTDWLSAAALMREQADYLERSARTDEWCRIAVLGGAAGSFRVLSQVRWPEGDYQVWCCTDLDLAGTRYAMQVAEAIAPRPIKRGTSIRTLLARLADQSPRLSNG